MTVLCNSRISVPANTMLSANVGVMLGHRLRRWPNINPLLAEYVVFATVAVYVTDLPPRCHYIVSEVYDLRVSSNITMFSPF